MTTFTTKINNTVTLFSAAKPNMTAKAANWNATLAAKAAAVSTTIANKVTAVGRALNKTTPATTSFAAKNWTSTKNWTATFAEVNSTKT